MDAVREGGFRTVAALHQDAADVVDLSSLATSHQLHKLRDVDILSFWNAGRMAYYRLEDGFAASLMHQAIVRVGRRREGRAMTQWCLSKYHK